MKSLLLLSTFGLLLHSGAALADLPDAGD